MSRSLIFFHLRTYRIVWVLNYFIYILPVLNALHKYKEIDFIQTLFRFFTFRRMKKCKLTKTCFMQWMLIYITRKIILIIIQELNMVQID